ncbi:MAG: hypothetical protein ABIR00_03840 [Nitrosospira sp.]
MEAKQASGVSSKLALTEHGQLWLNQIDEADRRLARDFLSMLTLVSHTEFERTVERLILRRVADIEGPIALFAVRELPKDCRDSYFNVACGPEGSTSTDAITRGADIGSEGRVVSFLRNLARACPRTLLNHPTIERMRNENCRAIFVIDDVLGSGNQTSSFLSAMWKDSTIKSWVSLGYLHFEVICYAVSEAGLQNLQKHRVKPKIEYEYFCPTLADIQPQKLQKPLSDIFKKYARRTLRPNLSCGYGNVSALMVFEHGCPNNTPAMLWALPAHKNLWFPLFPNRVVVGDARSVFPPEIVSRDSVSILLSVGHKTLAAVSSSIFQYPLPYAVLTLLALIAKGARTPSSLCYSLSMTVDDCNVLLEKCINAGYITQKYRLTDSGHAELKGAIRTRQHFRKELPELGEDVYYPNSLRSHIVG